MNPTVAYLMVLAGVTGHASSEFFAVLSGVAGAEASVWRYVLGSLGLIVIALAMPRTRDLWTPLKHDWKTLVPLSLVGVSGAYLAFHLALDYASIIQVGTLVTTIPIFVGLTNVVINKQPITAPKVITAIAAVAGVGLLLTDGYLARLAGDDRSIYGLLLTIVCAALGSAYAVMVKPLVRKYGAIRLTTVSMSIGGVGLWVVVGLAWGIWVNPATLFDKEPLAAWSLATLAFWNTTITQILWIGGLAAVPDITRGSYLFFLKPVITAVLALAILSQPITLVQALAIGVICSAVLVELFWPQRAQGAAPAKPGTKKRRA